MKTHKMTVETILFYYLKFQKLIKDSLSKMTQEHQTMLSIENFLSLLKLSQLLPKSQIEILPQLFSLIEIWSLQLQHHIEQLIEIKDNQFSKEIIKYFNLIQQENLPNFTYINLGKFCLLRAFFLNLQNKQMLSVDTKVLIEFIHLI